MPALFLAGQDAFLLEPLFRNEAWGFMCAPVSEANERAVYLSMAEGCRGALQVRARALGGPAQASPCAAAWTAPSTNPRSHDMLFFGGGVLAAQLSSLLVAWVVPCLPDHTPALLGTSAWHNPGEAGPAACRLQAGG